MLKRFFLALAVSAGLLAPAYAAGTISLSLTQQLDNASHLPLAGGKLYFFQAGTTTPQVAYQDTALTIPLPGGSIYTLDSNGRIPQFFLADGSIKIRLDNSLGVTQLAADNVLVIGPSSGGGAGSSVDPTTVLATGDIKTAYGTGQLTGFVRLNGRTIGSATSGASERANADCQALFQYLWTADSNLAVSTGRGVSAAADWAANKTIALPDGRGKALAGLDDMGNSAAGTYAGVSFFGGSPTTLGALVGTARRTLTASQLPANIPQTFAFSFTPNGGAATYLLTQNASANTNVTGGTGASFPTAGYAGVTLGGSVAISSGSINPSGGSAFDTVSPYMLITTYIKL